MCTADIKKSQGDNGFLIVSLSGELNKKVVREIRDKIIKAIRTGHNVESITVDLSDVSLIDTAGVALLVLLCQHVKSKGGTFRVVRPQDRVRRVFKLAQLEEFLTVENGNRQ